MLHIMIMAGGKGSRFWPKSRKSSPKQFLSIINNQALMDDTLDRIESLTLPQHRWILGNNEHAKQLIPYENRVPKENILKEPFGKNTAACIGWAAFEALKKDPDAICVILPADAWIHPTDLFQETLKKAVKEVEENNSVVTIGIPPTSPHTGYGYIEAKNSSPGIVTPIQRFVEKPNFNTAKAYVESGHYFWNAGIFVWKASKIVECLKEYLPNHFNIIESFTQKNIIQPDDIAPYYEKLENISIDYAIMEKISDDIKLIPANFNWSDIGNWSALEQFLPKDTHNNAVKGQLIASNSSNNIVFSEKRSVALCNINDLIIVDSEDALLILPKESDQDIKKLYDKLDPKLT
ncbi:mannose-1-phosphate guanylyltransferase [Candidatus Marinamargulisbacteria bacterium SCGC AG-343-D04]|nr:mannose-1-phosphate guanylyltransferase [Candidatus Marinamargulisbacteria bacterium SCGC AG-343-D04]